MPEPTNELRQLQELPVPPALDALVLRRAREEFLAQAASGATHGAEARSGDGGAAVMLPRAERYVYAMGLVAYGSQAVTGVAHLLWRAISG